MLILIFCVKVKVRDQDFFKNKKYNFLCKLMFNSFTGKKGKIKEKIALSERFSVENKTFSALSRRILYITQYVSIFISIIYIYLTIFM